MLSCGEQQDTYTSSCDMFALGMLSGLSHRHDNVLVFALSPVPAITQSHRSKKSQQLPSASFF